MSIYLTYSFLLAAVIFGTASNILAKYADGFTKLVPSIASAITIILCMSVSYTHLTLPTTPYV